MTEASKGNIIDRSLAFFSPKEGLRRLSQRRSYEAAMMGRRNKSMRGTGQAGPNLEISNALTVLRDRSRHFVRNNGWAKRAITAITNNTIGEGIRPAPTGSRPQIKKAKSIWKAWAESTTCDWYGKNTIYGLQNLIMSEIAEAGDCIIIRRRVEMSDENVLPIKIQVLEGDQLDHTKDGVNDRGFARLGVQFDNDGRLIGYWVWPQHPTDMTGRLISLQSFFVSKDDCLHPFEILRIGQVRGVPMGVASFMKLSDFSDYEDAQLIRQKAAASFCAFVSKSEDPDSEKIEALEPGIIQYLRENEEITFANPPTADGYSEYSKKILQGIAASYGITYEMLTMDYSNVNFSSGRMAKIDVSGNFKKWQYNMIVPQFCAPLWIWFMDACIMSGLLLRRVECSATDWTAPRVQQLDPVKETNARISAISAGLTTWSETIREDGRDPEEFLEEYKNDMANLKAAGVNFSSVMMSPDQNNNQNEKGV